MKQSNDKELTKNNGNNNFHSENNKVKDLAFFKILFV